MAEFPVGIITDEFSQDFERVCSTAAELGIPELEIRTAWGKNVLAMADEEIRRLKDAADRHGRRFACVASPVYKCVLPHGGDIDSRFHHDAFQASFEFDEQPGLLDRALAIAVRLEAPFVRVFSFWRTVNPERNFERILEVLQAGGEAARGTGVLLALENEHACHFATGEEVGWAAQRLDPEEYGIVWDPANACVSGERGVTDGYSHLAVDRVCHVHAKDCVIEAQTGRIDWCDVGAGEVGWPEQLAHLVRDGYCGSVSLETHWGGPGGDKYAGSTICAKSLLRLVAEA